mgnify:FL=1
MNAPLRLFVKLSARPLSRGAAACVCLSTLLAGCASPFAEASVDPASPVAQDVARMVREAREEPTFASIPPIPAADRKAGDWGRAADQLELAGARLEQETAANTWTLNDTTRFVARARSEAGPDFDGAASSAAATEAFARELRERATPPPPPR